MRSTTAATPIRVTSELCAYFRKLKAHGFTDEDFDAAAAAAMIMGALFHDAMGREMMPDAYPKPANKAPQRYARLLLKAIGARTAALVAVVAFVAAPALSNAQVITQPPPVTIPAASAQRTAGMVALSLDEAVQRAESQSEAVQIARAGVQRSEGQRLQARSQLFPQIFGSGGYTRTLKSQYQGIAGDDSSAPDTSGPQPPAPPCDAYLRDPSASVADRLAGLEQASRCGAGINPFAAFRSLPFGQANQYQFGLSVSQNLFTGGASRRRTKPPPPAGVRRTSSSPRSARR